MKRNSIFIVIFLLYFIGSNQAQSSYDILIQNETDESPASLLEIDDGNIICSIYSYNYARLLKINNKGDIIDSLDVSNPQNPTCYISELLLIDDYSFLALGEYQIDTNYYLWFLKIDFNFSIIDSVLIPVQGEIVDNFINGILNSEGNIVVCAPFKTQQPNDFDIFIFEIEQNGNVLKENYWGGATGGMKVVFDIAERIPGNYYLTSNSVNLNAKSNSFIYELDSNLNIINQGFNNWDIDSYSNILFIYDSVFILSGVKHFYNSYEPQMGLLKMDINYNELDSLHFGKLIDTVDYPGFHNNLSMITNDNIFYAGTSNIDIFNPFFSTWKSWFLIAKIDHNFNTKWERYYGGDAYYSLIATKATQDSGCVVAGYRYDYQTQNLERDVYILKVNEDGLITWAHNIPEVTKEILIYPNPGFDKIYIKTFKENLRIELFDSNGQKMIRQKVINQNITLNTSNLNSGVYIYRILNENNKTIETGKWIKN
jgi:hypothetical protein